MAPDDAEISLLIQATQAGLAAAPFPPRRDLSCVGLSTPSLSGDMLFHDIFWIRRRQVCCYVVRLPGGNRRVAAAHMLRMLLRAAMHRHAPGQAITLSLAALRRQRLEATNIDVAAAALRIGTGEADLAAVGSGGAVWLGAGQALAPDGCREQQVQLDRDHILWLTVGDVARPTPVDGSDAEELVRAALVGTHGAAAIAVALKKPNRKREHVYTLSNDVAQIGVTLAEIDEQLRLEGVPEDARAGLGIALDEVLTNIVLYAYDDGQAHEIILHLLVRGTTLCIDIRDDGLPFDPTTIAAVDTSGDLDDRPIGGLGMHFVRTVFDAVEYHRRRGWNALVLTKHFHDEVLNEPASVAVWSAAKDLE